MPHSGKQKKVQLQQKRREHREDASTDTSKANEEHKWWQVGLLEHDERVLRVRLAIARGRQHCQVRTVLHIMAQVADAPATHRATASERRAAQLDGHLVQIRRKLSSSRERPTTEALSLWREAAASAAVFAQQAVAESEEVQSAMGCRQTLFALIQQVLADRDG